MGSCGDNSLWVVRKHPADMEGGVALTPYEGMEDPGDGRDNDRQHRETKESKRGGKRMNKVRRFLSRINPLKRRSRRQGSQGSENKGFCLTLHGAMLPCDDPGLQPWTTSGSNLYYGSSCYKVPATNSDPPASPDCAQFTFIPYEPHTYVPHHAPTSPPALSSLAEHAPPRDHSTGERTSAAMPTIATLAKDFKLRSNTSASTEGCLHPPTNSPVAGLHVPLTPPTNPYLQTGSVYTSPDSGLSFPAHVDRQTLVGVGQYTRTVFAIKVYGVALYVNPGHVQASELKSLAYMNAEELSQSQAFYDALGKNGPAGFDRTIILKLNMQLGTSTMRSSLESDWKLLTSQHKVMMTESSFKPRPASQPILDLLSTGTSKCTCGQVAPPDVPSDPDCCARGTELSFTWRTTGNLEVRLNGVLMDTFTDPMMAPAIFYEYVRSDDPISPDARTRFADGFPSILRPGLLVPGVNVARRVKEEAAPRASAFFDGVQKAIVRAADDLVDKVKRPGRTAGEARAWVLGQLEGGVGNARSALEGLQRLTGRVGGAAGVEIAENATALRDDEGVSAESVVMYAAAMYLVLLLMVTLPFPPRGTGHTAKVEFRGVGRRTRRRYVIAKFDPSLEVIKEGSTGFVEAEGKGMKKSLSWCL